MVTGVNQISQQLSTSMNPTVNLQTKLQALAHNIGLGNSEDYTINHRNFQVNLHVDVHIDTVDLKKVLLGNPTLEFAASNHGTTTAGR
jgi:hypothetical protein